MLRRQWSNELPGSPCAHTEFRLLEMEVFAAPAVANSLDVNPPRHLAKELPQPS